MGRIVRHGPAAYRITRELGLGKRATREVTTQLQAIIVAMEMAMGGGIIYVNRIDKTGDKQIAIIKLSGI